MKVISLFDGIAGARQALKELGVKNDYYAVEIDKYAYHIATKNHWDIKHIGPNGYVYDVKDFLCEEWEKQPKEIQDIVDYTKHKEIFVDGHVDLLIGGSPCQDLSIAKQDRKGLKGNRSSLFFEYVRILKLIKPTYFILENVASMSKADKQEITDTLGIEPILINSALLTAQQRKRLYWVGKLVNGKYKQVKIEQPEDKKIVLKDVIEGGFVDREKSHAIISSIGRTTHREYFKKNQGQVVFDKPVRVSQLNKDCQSGRIYSIDGKSVCLNAGGGGGGAKTGLYEFKDGIRKLTITECERLQGFPDGYCDMVSKTQAYKALGNSFTVPVIKHILKNII